MQQKILLLYPQQYDNMVTDKKSTECEGVIMSNQKIRFGIVGTGTIAHRFAQAIKNVPNAQLAAVASRTKENAEKFDDIYDRRVKVRTRMAQKMGYKNFRQEHPRRKSIFPEYLFYFVITFHIYAFICRPTGCGSAA